MSGSEALAPTLLPPCSVSGSSTTSSPRDPPRRGFSRSHPSPPSSLTLVISLVAAEQCKLPSGPARRPLACLSSFDTSPQFAPASLSAATATLSTTDERQGGGRERRARRSRARPRGDEADGFFLRRCRFSRSLGRKQLPFLTFFRLKMGYRPRPHASILSLFFPSLSPSHPPHLSPRRR
jgi:hypothetical protein